MARKRGRKQARKRQHVAAAVATEAPRVVPSESRAREVARALSGTVARPNGTNRDGGRVTIDRPEFIFGGAVSLLPPTEGDLDWRLEGLDGPAFSRRTPSQLLDLLCDVSPDVSRALWDFLRFCNPGHTAKATGPDGQTEDKRAQVNLDAFLEILKGYYGSVDVILNRLFFGAFLRGALLSELVIDKSGNPVDLATPDPKIVKFQSRVDEARGHVWQPYQYQGSVRVPLDIPTIRYVPIDPAPGNPYGRPLATPAVFVTLFALGLLHDLRRVIAQQGYPRLDISVDLEIIKEVLPTSMQGDLDELKKVSDQLCKEVGMHYSTLQPDDAYVHNSAIIMNKPMGVVDTSSLGAIDGLVKYLETQATRALKSSALLFGISAGLSEASANRLMELHMQGIRALQHPCEGLLEYLCELALQAMGTPANVSFKFAELRKSEQLRDCQVETMNLHNAALAYYLGYASQEQAAEKAGYEKPDAAEPRLPGVGVQAAASAGGLAGDNAPAAAVPDAGANRGLLDTLMPALNGNGHAKEAA